MNRRKIICASIPIGVSSLSGCLGNIGGLTTKNRSDLSEFDEQGLQTYEEAYSRSKEALDSYNDGWNVYLNNVSHNSETLEDYPSDWQSLFDTMTSSRDSFQEATEFFNKSRELGESPEFNEPTVRAVEWAEAYLNSLSMFMDLGGPTKSRAISRHNEARGTDSPRPPETLLERILGEPTEDRTPLDEVVNKSS